MVRVWRDSMYQPGSQRVTYIRGVEFTDGVAEDHPGISDSTREFFNLIKVNLEEIPDGPPADSESLKAPEAADESPKAQEVVPEAQETTQKPSRTRKK